MRVKGGKGTRIVSTLLMVAKFSMKGFLVSYFRKLSKMINRNVALVVRSKVVALFMGWGVDVDIDSK